MKNWINVMMIFGLFGLSFNVQAHDVELDYSIKATGNKSFAIVIEKAAPATLELSLKDAKGFILASESIESGVKFAKRFNLDNLPDGNYTLHLESPTVLKVQPISIENNTLFIKKDKAKNIFKPSIQVKENHIDLTLLQLRRADTQIKLLSGNGTVLYIEDVHQFGSIQKRFNTAQLPAGNYQVVVRTSGQIFHEIVSLK